MDNVTLSDLSRMLHAIEHECSIRVKELRLEANEEYNRVKSELIVRREKELEREFQRRTKEIRSSQQREESRLRQAHRLKMESLKADLVDQVIERVKETVQNMCFDRALLDSILDKISIDEVFVFVDQRDEPETGKILSKTRIKYEIRRMPLEGIGGAIVCSKNGKEIWDNSFETRINIFVDSHADEISRSLFSE